MGVGWEVTRSACCSDSEYSISLIICKKFCVRRWVTLNYWHRVGLLGEQIYDVCWVLWILLQTNNNNTPADHTFGWKLSASMHSLTEASCTLTPSWSWHRIHLLLEFIFRNGLGRLVTFLCISSMVSLHSWRMHSIWGKNQKSWWPQSRMVHDLAENYCFWWK